MTSIFRSLIIVYALLILVSGLMPFAYMNTEDPALSQLLQWNGYSATLTLSPAILWVWAGVEFGVLAGLYLYWRSARIAFVVLLVLSTAMSAFEGVSVAHPLDIIVSSIMYPLQGALIAIAYLTSVANKFLSARIAVADNG